MKLSDALDVVYGHQNWGNPIRPYFVSGIPQDSPYEAFKKLKLPFQDVVRRLIGHEPEPQEDKTP